MVLISQTSTHSVKCSVRGRPIPELAWYKNNERLLGQDGLYQVTTVQQAIDIYSYNVTSTLTWGGMHITSFLIFYNFALNRFHEIL